MLSISNEILSIAAVNNLHRNMHCFIKSFNLILLCRIIERDEGNQGARIFYRKCM